VSTPPPDNPPTHDPRDPRARISLTSLDIQHTPRHNCGEKCGLVSRASYLVRAVRITAAASSPRESWKPTAWTLGHPGPNRSSSVSALIPGRGTWADAWQAREIEAWGVPPTVGLPTSGLCKGVEPRAAVGGDPWLVVPGQVGTDRGEGVCVRAGRQRVAIVQARQPDRQGRVVGPTRFAWQRGAGRSGRHPGRTRRPHPVPPRGTVEPLWAKHAAAKQMNRQIGVTLDLHASRRAIAAPGLPDRTDDTQAGVTRQVTAIARPRPRLRLCRMLPRRDTRVRQYGRANAMTTQWPGACGEIALVFFP
jgi:hypothetical protein